GRASTVAGGLLNIIVDFPGRAVRFSHLRGISVASLQTLLNQIQFRHCRISAERADADGGSRSLRRASFDVVSACHLTKWIADLLDRRSFQSDGGGAGLVSRRIEG